MKRFLTLCLLVALLLPCCAGASGLPDLGGSGLPVIGVTNDPSAGYLPDPADILGAKGETYATNYAYTSDYVCTVYLYGLPKDVDGFLRQYNEKAASLGFAVTAEEGRDMAPILRFLDKLHTGGSGCSLALRAGLVPALPVEQEEERSPAADCLLELGLYYEIYLPDKSSDYIKNRPEFEAAFRKTLERLY